MGKRSEPGSAARGAGADPDADAGFGRALRADARRNRERVLAAAREAFATDGPQVPLDDIARRAGVGAGTVYRHFPTKEALLEAVVFGRLADLVEEARMLLEAGDPGGAFFAFATRMAEEMAAKRDLLETLASSDAEPQIAGTTVADDLNSAFAELLGRAQRAGAVRTGIRVADVRMALAGPSLAMGGEQHGSSNTVLAIVLDGLRPHDDQGNRS